MEGKTNYSIKQNVLTKLYTLLEAKLKDTYAAAQLLHVDNYNPDLIFVRQKHK